jgi:hypothetical protein
MTTTCRSIHPARIVTKRRQYTHRPTETCILGLRFEFEHIVYPSASVGSIQNISCTIHGSRTVDIDIDVSSALEIWIRTKKKAVPLHALVALGVKRRYSSYSLLTSALDGGEWSASRPGRALPRGKDPQYPLYRRLGGPQTQSGHRG